MQENYKEFWREQISYEITYDGIKEYPREFDEQEKGWFDDEIENWQLLYDEDFTPHKNMKLNKKLEINQVDF